MRRKYNCHLHRLVYVADSSFAQWRHWLTKDLQHSQGDANTRDSVLHCSINIEELPEPDSSSTYPVGHKIYRRIFKWRLRQNQVKVYWRLVCKWAPKSLERQILSRYSGNWFVFDARSVFAIWSGKSYSHISLIGV